MESLGYDEREGYGSAGKLAGVWVAGERGAQKKVVGALQKAQLPIEEVMAKTLEGEINSLSGCMTSAVPTRTLRGWN